MKTTNVFCHGLEHRAVVDKDLSDMLIPEISHYCPQNRKICQHGPKNHYLCSTYLKLLKDKHKLNSTIKWLGLNKTKSGTNIVWSGPPHSRCISKYLSLCGISSDQFSYSGVSRSEVFVNLPRSSITDINDRIHKLFSSPHSLFQFHHTSPETPDWKKRIHFSYSIDSPCFTTEHFAEYNLKCYEITETPDFPMKLEMPVTFDTPIRDKSVIREIEKTVSGFLLSFCKWLSLDPLPLYRNQIGYPVKMPDHRGQGRDNRRVMQTIYWAENVNRDSNWIIDYQTLWNCLNLALCRPLEKSNLSTLINNSPYLQRLDGYKRYRLARFAVLTPKKAVQAPDCLLSLVS